MVFIFSRRCGCEPVCASKRTTSGWARHSGMTALLEIQKHQRASERPASRRRMFEATVLITFLELIHFATHCCELTLENHQYLIYIYLLSRRVYVKLRIVEQSQSVPRVPRLGVFFKGPTENTLCRPQDMNQQPSDHWYRPQCLLCCFISYC